MLRPGIAVGHDLHAHSWAVYSLWCSVLDGDWWPRWNPYLGYGMPLLQFYAPLGYLLCWPFQALGFGPIEAIKGVAVLSMVASAASSWTAVRWLGGSASGAAGAAVAFVLGPYHLLDLTVRLAWGELIVLPLLPLLFASVFTLEKNRSSILGCGLLLGLVLLSHTLTVVLVAPVLMLMLSRKNGLPFGLSLLIAAGLTAWFWLPFFAESHYTTLSGVAGEKPSELAVAGIELLSRQAWEAYGIRTTEGPQGMPLYAGAVFVLLLLPSLLGKGRFFAGTAIALLLLGCWPFAWLVDLVPGWNKMQFAWRLWGPALGLGALGIGLSLPESPYLLTMLLMALGWDASLYLGAPLKLPAYTELAHWTGITPNPLLELPETSLLRLEDAMYPPNHYRIRAARTRGAFPEFQTKALKNTLKNSSPAEFGVAARLPWGGDAIYFAPQSGTQRKRIDGWQNIKLPMQRAPGFLRLSLDGEAGTIRLTEAWFPGWEVRVDQGDWKEAEEDDGFLSIELPQGASEAELRFSGWRPWDRLVGNLCSIASLVGLIVLRKRL
jgi:hypothetical protein